MFPKTPRAVAIGSVLITVFFAHAGLFSQTVSNQNLADEISLAVRENPNQAQEIVARSIRSLPPSDPASGYDRQKAVAAIVGAVVASMPRNRAAGVLSAALAVEPGMSSTISQTALAVFPVGVRSQASSAIPMPGKVPGFAKVLQLEGGEAVAVDPDGKREPLREGDFLLQGSGVSTGPNASVDLLFENGATIRIEPGTEFSLDRLMISPFDAGTVDYQNLKEEPGTSNTMVGVPSGTILFDVAKLKKNSSFQISTPLGIAGIRGTAGFVRAVSTDAKAPVSFGLASGLADFATPNGNRRSVAGGESFGVAGPRQGYLMESNPPNSRNLIQQAGSFGAKIRSQSGAAPFRNAPPRPQTSAPSALSPSQILALEQAALESGEALVQTAVLLAMESPFLALEIAAFASALMPPMAIEVALAISGLYPNLAPALAAKIAAVVPAMAATIALELIRENPNLAVSVASSTVAVAPDAALSIVSSVANQFPAQAPAVAAALMAVLPSQGDVVRETVQSILLFGGPNNPGQSPITPPLPDNTTQNPSILNPLPTPTPQPTPSPVPPTPTPTPVSPSA